MAAEQKEAAAAPAATEFDGGTWLQTTLGTLERNPDAAAKSRAEATLDGFIKAALQPGHTVSKNVVGSIKSWIALLDKKLTDQVNEVMHQPDFQKLESTWRGLFYLADKTETGPLLKLKVLNTTKAEVQNDMEEAGEAFNESETYKKIHDEGYGILGGEPYGMLVGDYDFDCKNTMDVGTVIIFLCDDC